MAKRYFLAPGKDFYLPFGAQEAITRKNISDEVVADLVERFPKLLGSVFIDSEATDESTEPKAPVSQQKPAEQPLERTSKADLHKKYFQLTGKAADDKLNHAGLVALVSKEIEAAKLLG